MFPPWSHGPWSHWWPHRSTIFNDQRLWRVCSSCGGSQAITSIANGDGRSFKLSRPIRLFRSVKATPLWTTSIKSRLPNEKTTWRASGWCVQRMPQMCIETADKIAGRDFEILLPTFLAQRAASVDRRRLQHRSTSISGDVAKSLQDWMATTTEMSRVRRVVGSDRQFPSRHLRFMRFSSLLADCRF